MELKICRKEFKYDRKVKVNFVVHVELEQNKQT